MLFNSIIAAALGLALAAFYANKVLSIKVTDEKRGNLVKYKYFMIKY